MTKRSVAFRSSHEPALRPGEYQLAIDHHLENTAPRGPDDTIDETHHAQLDFAVGGERFCLDPGEVLSLFPPVDSRGDHDHVLPHVVLKRRSLPWERTAEADDVGATPWLAVLVFDAAGAPSPQPATVSGLIYSSPSPDPTNPNPLPADTGSYGDFVKDTATWLEWGESWSDATSVIDVNVADLIAQLPSAKGISWLAHVRHIETVTPSATVSTEVSVVAAGRLPLPNGRSTAYLVSLESMGAILPADESSAPPSALTLPSTRRVNKVRLVVLASWSFSCVDPSGTFAGYLEHLDFDPPTLRLPDPPADSNYASDPVADAAVALGYSALRHDTRLGDATVSWYRGPLLPDPGALGPGISSDALPYDDADAAVRYDPQTGMFDVSLAAAWELGRLQALASKSFSEALFAFKRAALHKTARAAAARANATLCSAVPDSPNPLAAATALLAGPLRVRLTGTQNPPQPAAPPTPSRASSGHTPSANLGTRFLEAYSDLLSDRDALRELHADTEVPSAVSSWLRVLASLATVPFGYLVPDLAMLPVGSATAPPYGSLRFFTLDTAWIAALIDGACSIGRATAADAAVDWATAALLRDAANIPTSASGFLLRSPAVAGWPNLGVDPYDANGDLIDAEPLLLAQLDTSLLLYIVPGQLSGVQIHEPLEGLHFGFDIPKAPSPPNPYVKSLRWITVPSNAPHGAVPGSIIDQDQTNPKTFLQVTFRPADPRVVRIADLSAAMGPALVALHADNDSSGAPVPFTGAQFALEMLESAQAVRFGTGWKP